MYLWDPQNPKVSNMKQTGCIKTFWGAGEISRQQSLEAHSSSQAIPTNWSHKTHNITSCDHPHVGRGEGKDRPKERLRASDVTHLVECLTTMYETLGSTPGPYKLGVVAHTIIPALGRQTQEEQSPVSSLWGQLKIHDSQFLVSPW